MKKVVLIELTLIRQVILDQYPDTWDWVVEMMTWALGR